MAFGCVTLLVRAVSIQEAIKLGGTRLGLLYNSSRTQGLGSREIYLILIESNILSWSEDIPLDFTQGNKLAMHNP